MRLSFFVLHIQQIIWIGNIGGLIIAKSNITTSIDPLLKCSFEATKSIHNMTFAEVLEKGIKQELEENSPLELVKLLISQKEQDLSELRSQHAELEVLEKQNKLRKKEGSKKDPETEKRLEDLRNKKYSENIKPVKLQLSRGQTVNWKKMAPLYHFTNEKDLKTWFFKKMEQEQDFEH